MFRVFFTEHMQRIFKHDDLPNINLTPEKLNILICRVPDMLVSVIASATAVELLMLTVPVIRVIIVHISVLSCVRQVFPSEHG